MIELNGLRFSLAINLSFLNLIDLMEYRSSCNVTCKTESVERELS